MGELSGLPNIGKTVEEQLVQVGIKTEDELKISSIFYYSKDDHGEKISNLVRMIGQDETIRRTGSVHKSISFKLRQPMNTI